MITKDKEWELRVTEQFLPSPCNMQTIFIPPPNCLHIRKVFFIFTLSRWLPVNLIGLLLQLCQDIVTCYMAFDNVWTSFWMKRALILVSSPNFKTYWITSVRDQECHPTPPHPSFPAQGWNLNPTSNFLFRYAYFPISQNLYYSPLVIHISHIRNSNILIFGEKKKKL